MISITMISFDLTHIRERVRVSTLHILAAMALIILLLLAGVAQARAEDDPALNEIAQKIQTIANHIGKWELKQAEALVLSLSSLPGEFISEKFTRLEQKEKMLTAEFGPILECRFVRSSVLLDFSHQYRYAIFFDRGIMSILFNIYRSNGKWELNFFQLIVFMMTCM